MENQALVLRSPIRHVADVAWTKYVSKSVVAGTLKGYVGAFCFSYPALGDQLLVTNIRRTDGVFVGDWVAPYNLERFLSSIPLQYSIFSKRSVLHCKTIRRRYREFINSEIKVGDMTTKCTVSGLMAISHRIGLGGLDGWISGDRMSVATDLFVGKNGIF